MKPCELTIVEREYTYKTALQHVRRVLDLVSPTLKLGRASSLEEDKLNEARQAAEAAAESANRRGGNGDKTKEEGESAEELAKAAVAAAQAESVMGTSDDCDLHGVPVYLENFYSFFSMGHISPPFTELKLLDVAPQSSQRQGDTFLHLQVETSAVESDGESAPLKTALEIACCELGFYANGDRSTRQHSLVALLRCHLLGFKQRYSNLLAAFSERNPFGTQ